MNTNSSGGELVLLLTETNGGTRISSTRYVHYGTITARRASSLLSTRGSLCSDVASLSYNDAWTIQSRLVAGMVLSQPSSR